MALSFKPCNQWQFFSPRTLNSLLVSFPNIFRAFFLYLLFLSFCLFFLEFSFTHIQLYMYVYTPVCVLSHFSHIQPFTTLWTVAHQAPLSMGFSRQECWSGLPCPAPEDLSNPGIKHTSVCLSCMAGKFFTH